MTLLIVSGFRELEMSIQKIGLATVAGFALAFAGMDAAADSSDPVYRLSTGIDYTSGDYGGTVDIEDVYIPLTGIVDYGRFGFRLTVPYLSVTAPAGTIITGPGGQPVPGTGALTTESGLGDIIGSVTLYDVVYNRELGLALDITGKIKFATADEAKGLGTGEHDYSVQADLYKYLGEFTLLGTAGYKVRGDPAGVDLENVLFGSIGGIYNFPRETRGGLIFDYRESAISSNDSIREITGFVSRPINNDWRLMLYALTGFSDSSPDFGGGVLVKRTF
jgi:hypothetical protein